MEYLIPKEMSLHEALTYMYPDCSGRTLKNWLEKGRFTVDGTLVKRGNVLLKPQQLVVANEIILPPKVAGLNILYEDRYLIVIDKPIGLLTVPLDEGSDLKKHALGILKDHFRIDGIFPAHRIDKDASGVVLFARGKEAEERLKIHFEKHDLRRQYFAIVEGRLRENSGTWQCKLKELPNYDVVESSDGRDAITHFKVIRRSAKYTYLELLLETGRKHQIRVHCQRAGHPILGDRRYGARENTARRLCLHAALLELTHPFTQKKLSFSSPMPKAFKLLGVE